MLEDTACEWEDIGYASGWTVADAVVSMTKEEKVELFSAFLDGKEIEAFCLYYEDEELIRGWQKTWFNLFHNDVPVRIKE